MDFTSQSNRLDTMRRHTRGIIDAIFFHQKNLLTTDETKRQSHKYLIGLIQRENVEWMDPNELTMTISSRDEN